MKNHLAENLKRLRLHKGRTQNHMASCIALTRSTYSGYENGSAEPTLDTLLRISKYLHLPLDVLIGMEVPLPGSLAMNVFLAQHTRTESNE